MITINNTTYSKFDLHVHTAETSKCGTVDAASIVGKYKATGYDGIVITDHLHESYISLQNCRDDWQECVTRFLFGYHQAKQAGEKIGFDVALGVELRFPENDNDYLLYGVDEAFLRSHPYLYRTDHASFYRRFADELLIIHAHPYRNNDVVYYDSVHGLEIVNCSPRHNSRNELTLKLAKENPNLFRVCGSDAHRPGDECRAAVLLEGEAHDSHDVKRIIESGRYGLWCPEYESIIKESELNVCDTTH